MINCISGVYQPSKGSRFLVKGLRQMNSHQVAELGVARTFQNVALFKGMTVLDNMMTGRLLKMRGQLPAARIHWGAAEREELEQRARRRARS